MTDTALTTVELNGVSLAYRDSGNGLPVVFIHGHPFDQSMWNGQVAALSGSFRIITLDLRGYGASSVPTADSTTLDTLASDVNNLLDHLHIEKAVIAGLSMGGQIAMAFADRYPHRLAGVVLAACFPQADASDVALARRVSADRILNEGTLLPSLEMLPKLLSPASFKRHPELAVQVLAMIARTPPAGAAAAMRGRSYRKDYTPALHRIAVPTLIFVGTQDGYTTVANATKMQQAIPHAQLEVLESVGHLPNLEAPDRFNAVLHEFLVKLQD